MRKPPRRPALNLLMDMAPTTSAGRASPWPSRPGAGKHRWPLPLRIAVRVLLAMVFAVFLAWLVLYVTKGRFLRHPFERFASHALERQVTVGGDFNLYLDPLDIHFLAEKLHIANPKWSRTPDFFHADRVETRIRSLPLLFGRREIKWIALNGSDVATEWDAQHRRNTWTFGDPDQPGKPLELPRIERGVVIGTRIAYRDPKLRLSADIAVDTVRAKDTRFANEIRFTGGGSMRAQPFTLTGRLLSPNETVTTGKTPLVLHVDAGHSVLDVDGTLPRGIQLAGADLAVRARGENLAWLFDVIGVAVPPTRAYRLASDVTYDGDTWRLRHLRGTFGDSDLAGSLSIAMPKNRVKLSADLATRALDIIDAGPFIGYDPRRLAAAGAKGAVVHVAGHPRVLPDAPLRLDAVRAFDADVRYRVATIRAKNLPVSDIDLNLLLDHSLLRLRPVSANVAGGRLTARVMIDARKPTILTDYDVRLSPTPMGRLLARFGVSESGTSGTLTARVQLRGQGESLRQSLATSNGRMAFIIPAGTMWTRNIQLAELDIGTFLQKMFQKKLKEPVAINCGLIAFTVRDGIAAADPILIDTKKNVILGRGGFSFKSEAIDMSIRADAKTFSLFSGQSPVGVGGYFAAPTINPISPQLIARAGVAAGAGALISPFAAILAFIDPGDAKAAACGPVLAGAHARAMRTTKGKPRDDVGNGTPAKSKKGQDKPAEKQAQRRKFTGP